jgi:hypothetical protein
MARVLDNRNLRYQNNIWSPVIPNNKRFTFDGGFLPEDPTYRLDNLLTTTDVQGAQPRKAMPHKVTKKFSSLELNEWYLINLQNPSTPELPDAEQRLIDARAAAGKDSPYLGPLYRGAFNLFRYNTRMNQPTQGDDDATSCKRMVESRTAGRSAYNPEWQRLEMDNCTNQFILQQSARFSNMSFEQRNSPTPTYSARTCQPFRMVAPADADQEYAADWYYSIAWQKLLGDSNFLARGGTAPTEPNYGGSGSDSHNITITDPITTPNRNFGRTELKDLATAGLQLERIMDPSHPFSPRWDFEFNERLRYSPITTIYGGSPVDAVRCAETVPVDIMKWRETRYDQHIMSRIGFNIFCYFARFGKVRCWDIFRCTSAEPCCATKYNGRDKVPTPLVQRRLT